MVVGGCECIHEEQRNIRNTMNSEQTDSSNF